MLVSYLFNSLVWVVRSSDHFLYALGYPSSGGLVSILNQESRLLVTKAPPMSRSWQCLVFYCLFLPQIPVTSAAGHIQRCISSDKVVP